MKTGRLPSDRSKPWRVRHFGFTLIELLIVIVIVGMLAALCAPAFRNVLEKSKATKCMSNMRQVSSAIFQYGAEHDNDLIPAVIYNDNTGATGKPWSYILDDEDLLPKKSYDGIWDGVMTCPSRGKVATAAYNGIHYGMNWYPGFVNTRVLGQPAYKTLKVARPGRTMLLGEVKGFYMIQYTDLSKMIYPHGNANNVIFMDGHGEPVLGPWLKPSGTNSVPFY